MCVKHKSLCEILLVFKDLVLCVKRLNITVNIYKLFILCYLY